MIERNASCACGQMRVACRGEPLKVSLCHCRACRRRTGGPFDVAAFVMPDRLSVRGEVRAFRRGSDSGFDPIFRFCPTCDSTVWWDGLRVTDRIAVAPGAFADPDFPGPSQAVYGAHRPGWIPTDIA